MFEIFDVSFSDGLAYFSLKANYREWLKTVPETARPVSHLNLTTDYSSKVFQTGLACDNHEAGRDNNVRWGGLDETGVGACSCTSHGCLMPRGMVDYLKGERHVPTSLISFRPHLTTFPTISLVCNILVKSVTSCHVGRMLHSC